MMPAGARATCGTPLSLLSLASPGLAVRGKPVRRDDSPPDFRQIAASPLPAPLRGSAMYRDVQVPRVQDAYERPSAALILGSLENERRASYSRFIDKGFYSYSSSI